VSRSDREPAEFLRGFLKEFIENQLVNSLMTPDEYQNYLGGLQRDARLADISQELFASSPKPLPVPSFGRLRLIFLREPDGAQFPFLQGMKRSNSPIGKKTTCFVGHRFVEEIETSLRFNLIHLFEPHRIALRWSGYDLSSKDIFEDIVAGIRSADFCLFDNLGTLNRPNVYIEIGIAYALDKPMVVCEYVGKGRKRVHDTGSVPSDLQGLFRIQYRSYEELTRKLYFGLPMFLDRHRLL